MSAPTILDHLAFDPAAREELSRLLVEHADAHAERETATDRWIESGMADEDADARQSNAAIRCSMATDALRAWTRAALARSTAPQPRSEARL